MEYGKVPGVGKPISRLVQGTVMVTSKELDRSFALLDAVYELGCRTFDTAHGYGNGDCERTVGRWVRERGVRDDMVIIGKGAHHNADRRRVTSFDITSDLYDSLARFKFDFIDLYLLHRDDPRVPVEPIIDTLNEHLRAGRIHAFGASNWTVERIQAANAYASANGLTGFVASSPNFSLAEQVKEPWEGCISISGPSGEAARAWYAETEMPLFTWSSLAGGFFSGRFRRDNLDTFESPLDKLCVQSYCYEDNFKRLDRAETLAAQKGVPLPQLALAYVLHQPLKIFTLVGCQSGAEFAQNAAALQLTLTPHELAWLDLKRDDHK
jgi:aryl-alcohol dehydrogenase-like predicted oxidoreductase